MIVPAAMNVETAVDMLREVPAAVINDQTKEFAAAMGADACASMGLKFPLSDEAIVGYKLGLQTARAVVMGSAALAMKGVDAKDVL